jgi:predicted lysophospholipase L1 biosynthesis ABC-type transport system permease subunit
MADEFFPNEDPIGKRLLGISDQPYEVVGIVGDARQYLSLPADPTMYFPLLEGGPQFAAMVIRAQSDPNLLSLPIQKEMRRLDPDLPAVTVRTMDEVASLQTSQTRFALTLIGLFGVLSAILASLGVYGVLAYAIAQRTREFGIRIALGANAPVIARMVMFEGMKPAAAGLLGGLLLGAAASRLLESFLFDVKPMDASVLASAMVLLAAVALAACLIPAWRASRTDPVIALQSE